MLERLAAMVRGHTGRTVSRAQGALSVAAEFVSLDRGARVLAVRQGDRWCLGFLDPSTRTIRCCLAGSQEEAAAACGGRRLHVGTALISYPRRFLTRKAIVLPTADADEARRMIAYELPDLLPYDEDELIYDYHLGRADEAGYSRACVFAGRADALESCFDEFGKLGGNAEAAIPTSIAFYRWYRSYRNARMEGTESLLVVSSNGSEVLVGDGEDLIFSRALAQTGGNGTFSERLTSELSRSFDLYRRESRKWPLQRMTVVCDDAETLEPALDAAARVCPDAVLLPEEATLEPLPGYVLEGADAVPLSTKLLLLGMALPAGASGVGSVALAPSGVVESRIRTQRRRKVLSNLAMLLVNLLLVFLLLTAMVRARSSQLQGLERRRQELAPVAGELNEKRSQLGLLKSVLHRRHLALKIIGELYGITPTEVAITRLTVDEGGHVRLDGTARELSQVFDFIRILEGSPSFGSVAYGHSVMSTVGNRQYVTFYLEMDSHF